MKLSARNVILGKVIYIKQGAVNVEVVLEVAPQVQLVSIITKQACESLKLREGMQAYAAIKASNVMIAVSPTSMRETSISLRSVVSMRSCSRSAISMAGCPGAIHSLSLMYSSLMVPSKGAFILSIFKGNSLTGGSHDCL